MTDTKAVAEVKPLSEVIARAKEIYMRDMSQQANRDELIKVLLPDLAPILVRARECEALREQLATVTNELKALTDSARSAATLVVDLQESVASREREVCALYQAIDSAYAQFGIRKDPSGGMVTLLTAVSRSRNSALAIEQRIRDEAIESAARVAELDSEGRSLHLTARIRALKGTK